MRTNTTLIITIVLGLITSAFSPDANTDTYTGYAYAGGTKKLIYTEEFTDKFVDGKHVETLTRYFNPDGKLIAQRDMSFSSSPFSPNFETKDLRTGYVEGAEVKGDQVRLFFKKDENSKMKEKTLSVPKPAVIDGGFNKFIKANWDKLESGKTLVFYFTVSARLDYYKLHAIVTAKDSETMTVKIEPDRTVMRWLASPIMIKYDVRTRRILSYEGKSNIADEHGENFETRLVYPKKGP